VGSDSDSGRHDVHLIWEEIKAAVPLIVHGDPTLLNIIWFTLQVAVTATAAATVIGVPIGLAIGLGRFRGRRVLHLLANASLGLPPVVVGIFLYIVFLPPGPFGSWHMIDTRRAVFLAQTVLALPYTVALTAAAVQGLPGGLVAQARSFGAGRVQLGVLALREARIGVMAAVIAALGTSLAEVAAIAIFGGNIYSYDQTLASASLFDVNAGHYADAVAIAIVLMVMILALMCGLAALQRQGDGLRMRFRVAT
jgi:tungstate transport system permease protein